MPTTSETISKYLDWINIYAHPGLGPFFGAIIAAIIAAVAAWTIAHIFTRHIKQIEAIYQFNRWYQELMAKQHRINSDFYYDDRGNLREPFPLPSKKDEKIAQDFFNEFFDFMYAESLYFQERLVGLDIFTEWARWRWYDWDPTRDQRGAAKPPVGVVCGISYRMGWEKRKEAPAVRGSPFARFLDAVHEAPNETGLKRAIERWRRKAFRGVNQA